MEQSAMREKKAPFVSIEEKSFIHSSKRGWVWVMNKKSELKEKGEMRFIIKYSSFGENVQSSSALWMNVGRINFLPPLAAASIFVCIKRTIFNLKIEFEMFACWWRRWWILFFYAFFSFAFFPFIMLQVGRCGWHGWCLGGALEIDDLYVWQRQTGLAWRSWVFHQNCFGLDFRIRNESPPDGPFPWLIYDFNFSGLGRPVDGRIISSIIDPNSFINGRDLSQGL